MWKFFEHLAKKFFECLKFNGLVSRILESKNVETYVNIKETWLNKFEREAKKNLSGYSRITWYT